MFSFFKFSTQNEDSQTFIRFIGVVFPTKNISIVIETVIYNFQEKIFKVVKKTVFNFLLFSFLQTTCQTNLLYLFHNVIVFFEVFKQQRFSFLFSVLVRREQFFQNFFGLLKMFYAYSWS